METINRQVCIPDIGTVVRLVEPWTFAVYNEHRNDSLIELFNVPQKKTNRWEDYGNILDFVTLPAGTEMAVDRVYIRQGLEGFSSITFRVQKSDDERFYQTVTKKKTTTKVFRKCRFWAKLADVNCANMIIVEDKSTGAKAK